MNILVFDTCFEACSAAVVRAVPGGVSVSAARFEPMAQGHAERLIPMIAEVMDEVGLGFSQLDRIGVTVGPGSFTGTRIGVAAARAFALAHGTTLAGLTSLEVMAAEAGQHAGATQGRQILVAVDVRRGETYCQLFDFRGMVAQGEPRIMTVAEAADSVRGRAVWAVGSAAEGIAAHAGDEGRLSWGLAKLLPDARFAVTLVKSRLDTMPQVVPLYLRAPDAKPPASGPLLRAVHL